MRMSFHVLAHSKKTRNCDAYGIAWTVTYKRRFDVILGFVYWDPNRHRHMFRGENGAHLDADALREISNFMKGKGKERECRRSRRG